MTEPRLDFRVAPGGALRGRVRVPGDKSVSHRAVLLGGIARGTTTIQGFLEGEDTLATLAALGEMGIPFELKTCGSRCQEQQYCCNRLYFHGSFPSCRKV